MQGLSWQKPGLRSFFQPWKDSKILFSVSSTVNLEPHGQSCQMFLLADPGSLSLHSNKFACFWWFPSVLKDFFIRYFLHLHLKCYPQRPLYLPSTLFPNPQTPASLALAFPFPWTYALHKTKGLSSHWWPTRSSSTTYATRDTALGVLVSSYCCSSYRVADPFSSLGTFSSSSTGGSVFHPIADYEHPLLCLPDPGIASQETAISGSCHQNLAGICNSVCIWWLIIGQIQSVVISFLLRMGDKIPMEGVTEKMFGAEMEGRIIQRLPYPAIYLKAIS